MIELPQPSPAGGPARRGFTLLELLVVIVIISLLLALIFPAISGARANVEVANVRVDITALEDGLANFKAVFGEYPPSEVILYERASGFSVDPSWDTDTADPSGLTRSRGIITRLWQQFDFTIDRDINGDGDTVDKLTLTGAECLTFFLGGVRNASQDEDLDQDCMLDAGEDLNMNGKLDVAVPVGFSKNPANPFLLSGTSREGPFYEFDSERLMDLDCDRMLEIKDPIGGQTRPYIYASSYDGTGYRAGELTGAMTDVYQQSSAAWKPQTFQIVSPGFDREYGTGGVYDADKVDVDLTGVRQVERDNITNFQSGTLAPTY